MTDVLVLCYHAVSPTWPAALSVTPEALRAQVRGLLESGYVPATFSAAVPSGRGARTLAVTFDDAYRSTIELGLPVLAELGVPATVFVPSGFVDSPEPMAWAGIDRWLEGPHRSELRCMSAAQLKELSAAGWEIGSHTRSHPRLTGLGDGELAEQLGSSRERLEDLLGTECRSIAYPYGDADRRVAEAAQAQGYDSGAGLSPYHSGSDPMLWPRVGVYHADGSRRFALKVSRLARRVGLARLRYRLARGKQITGPGLGPDPVKS